MISVKFKPKGEIIRYYIEGTEITRDELYNAYVFNPHELISFLSAYWLVYVNEVSIDNPDYQEDVKSFNYDTTRAKNMVNKKIKEFYEKVYRLYAWNFTEDVTFDYPAEVWGGGRDLIKVNDVITCAGADYTVKGVEIIELDGGGWTAHYTVTNSDDEEMIFDAYDLYMCEFSLTREMKVLELSFERQLDEEDFDNYIQTTYNVDMLEIYHLMLEAKGNREPGLFE